MKQTKKIQPTQANNQLLADCIAIKLKTNLEAKKSFAQDLINSIEVGIK